jgi:hypothetical protein
MTTNNNSSNLRSNLWKVELNGSNLANELEYSSIARKEEVFR